MKEIALDLTAYIEEEYIGGISTYKLMGSKSCRSRANYILTKAMSHITYEALQLKKWRRNLRTIGEEGFLK